MNARRFFTHPAGIAAGSVGSTMLWGSAYPTLKRSYEELGIDGTDWFEQFLFAGYRFTLAGLLIFLFMIVIREPLRYRSGSGKTIAALGGVQTMLQYVFFYTGMAHSSGVFGAVIAGTISFFTIVLTHMTDPSDRLTRNKTAGLMLGLIGLLLLALPRAIEQGWSSALGTGELLLLASAFCAGLGNLLSKKAVAKLPVAYVNGYQMLLGGVALLALGGSAIGLSPFHWTAAAAWLLVYAAFISSAGFVLWNYVMKYNSVGSTASFLFLTPVFGVILSSVFLHETIGMAVIASLTSVCTGIVLVNRKIVKKRLAVSSSNAAR